MIRYHVIDRLVRFTIRQFDDGYGRRPAGFEEFADFISEYPAVAWKNDYVRYGGEQGLEIEPAAIEAAVRSHARRLLERSARRSPAA